MRYRPTDLLAYAEALLSHAGLDAEKARAVAEILLEGDLLGHNTHGFAQLAGYLGELKSGAMVKDGGPTVLADHPAAITWDGRRLPGPWLVLKAMDLAIERAARLGTCTVVIRRSHHIACLAAFLKRATDQGLMMILTCSDPNGESVAPFGGLDPVFTPNPISAGIPTSTLPVLMDVSTSATTNGMTGRLHKEGRHLPAHWVMDGHGEPSADPAVLFNEPKGTILPLGGKDSGHKGYGLTLLVEALTGGLAGHGRADPKEGWGATVFLQIIDPRAFAGLEAFTRQTDKVTQSCRASRPAKAGHAVRTPGENGLKLLQQQLLDGVGLYPSIIPSLASWGEAYQVKAPEPIPEG
jgi:L-lactate dehydrogenase